MGNFVDEIRKHNDISRQNIIKSFGGGQDLIAKAEGNELDEVYVELFGDTIQKAVYADTPQNRKLGRVGQEYHRGKGKKEEDSKPSKTKLEKVGNMSWLHTNGKHKYISHSTNYESGEGGKKDFVKEVKAYLKKNGETFDPSKLSVKKEKGYDHRKHSIYTYTLSGNRDEAEKLDNEYTKQENKKAGEKYHAGYDEWKKKNKTAEQALGVDRTDLILKIHQHATKEEREKLYEGNEIAHEKAMLEVGKRLKKEGLI